MKNRADNFIRVENTGKRKVKNFDLKLQKMGLSKESPSIFSGRVSAAQTAKIKKFADKYKLKFVLNEKYSARSTKYRAAYFDENNKEKYRCVYCGRKYPKDKITIDHLYPIAKVSKSVNLQNKMKKSGITNVNDLPNLVTACFSCNRKKSDNLGIWIIKGKIGKYEWLWKIRWVFRIVLIIFCMLLLLAFFLEYFTQIHIFSLFFDFF